MRVSITRTSALGWKRSRAGDRTTIDGAEGRPAAALPSPGRGTIIEAMTRARRLSLVVLLAVGSGCPPPAPEQPPAPREGAGAPSPAGEGLVPVPAPASGEGSAPADAPTPAAPMPPPLEVTQERGGLRWTTRATLDQPEPELLVLDLAITVTNQGDTPAPVTLARPTSSQLLSLLPGEEAETLGFLGMQGEGVGSSPCSPLHGGPTILGPKEARSFGRQIELAPLPWPKGHGRRVDAHVVDCRPGAPMVEVIKVIVVPARGSLGPALLLADQPPPADELDELDPLDDG